MLTCWLADTMIGPMATLLLVAHGSFPSFRPKILYSRWPIVSYWMPGHPFRWYAKWLQHGKEIGSHKLKKGWRRFKTHLLYQNQDKFPSSRFLIASLPFLFIPTLTGPTKREKDCLSIPEFLKQPVIVTNGLCSSKRSHSNPFISGIRNVATILHPSTANQQDSNRSEKKHECVNDSPIPEPNKLDNLPNPDWFCTSDIVSSLTFVKLTFRLPTFVRKHKVGLVLPSRKLTVILLGQGFLDCRFRREIVRCNLIAVQITYDTM